MDTYANLKGLAISFYKNKRNAVELILREAISNAIHACIIQYKYNESNKYSPEISIIINSKENSIKVEDNGIGFSEDDKRLFFNIAKSNVLKQENKLPSKGLGRLVFIYFARNIYYETTHNRKYISFEYPQQESNLFKIFNQEFENTTKENGTSLSLEIDEKYLKTFIKKYANPIEKFEEWIIDNFAFLLYDFKELKINALIDDKRIEKKFSNIHKKEFTIKIDTKEFPIEMLIVNSKSNLDIKLVAHKLLIEKKVDYDRIINNLNKKIYISSPLLDDRITADGLNAEIEDIKSELDKEITRVLDKEFDELIAKQREKSRENLGITKSELPFLAEFMPDFESINGYKIKNKNDFIQDAINEKGKLEQNFWESKDEQLDTRLQKSSLYLYVKHRERVLAKLEQMMGDSNFKEDDFHQLLTDRKCENLEVANHNLWLLDDKFSYFFEAHNAKIGESSVDVEFYLNPFINDEEQPTHIVLLELKKPTRAHNPGKMIEQLKKYATKIYDNAKTKNGVNINVEKCKFFGYIVADINDVKNEEMKQDKDIFKLIPYTESSFEGKVSFIPTHKNERVDLYLTLLSTQDLLRIAKFRNKTLFEILNMTNPKVSE